MITASLSQALGTWPKRHWDQDLGLGSQFCFYAPRIDKFQSGVPHNVILASHPPGWDCGVRVEARIAYCPINRYCCTPGHEDTAERARKSGQMTVGNGLE